MVKNNVLYIDGGIETFIDIVNNTLTNTTSQVGSIITGYSKRFFKTHFSRPRTKNCRQLPHQR